MFRILKEIVNSIIALCVLESMVIRVTHTHTLPFGFSNLLIIQKCISHMQRANGKHTCVVMVSWCGSSSGGIFVPMQYSFSIAYTCGLDWNFG